MNIVFKRKAGLRGYVTCFRRGEAIFEARSLTSRDRDLEGEPPEMRLKGRLAAKDCLGFSLVSSEESMKVLVLGL